MRIPKLLMFGLLVSWPVLGQVSPSSGVARDRCDERTLEDGILYRDAPRELAIQHFRPSRTFAEGAAVICEQRGNYELPRKVIELQEEFGSKDGYDYRLSYTSGSGAVVTAGNARNILDGKLWDISCKVDTMDDSKQCYLYRNGLFVYHEGPGKWNVRLGAGHIAKSEIAVRFGEGVAIRGVEPEFGPAASKQIVESLKNPSRVRTRYFEFPSKIHEDEFQNEGFALAAELIEWSYQHLVP